MFPIVNIFGKDISSYNILVIIGVLVSIFYIIKKCKKNNINDNDVISLLLISSIGIVIGSHILYAITNYKLILIFIANIKKISSFKFLCTCLYEIFGGSVFYGGLIGGMIVFYIICRKRKYDIKLYSDLCTPIIPLFHTFGRIGCFLVGCCYGIPFKYGFVFTSSLIESANGVKRLPIQLIEALFNLIIFIILEKVSKKKKFQGKLIYLYLLIYSVLRFIIEIFRGDSYRGFLFGLSTSQIISLIIFIIVIIRLIFINRKKIKKI